LKVGFIFTYIAPLVFVILVTLFKEAYDDIYRWKQDKKSNSETYTKILNNGNKISVKSSEIQVGDLLEINQNERLPADLILLKTFVENLEDDNKDESCYIRTDQLDGETDWKLRKAPRLTQNLELIQKANMCIQIDPPSKMIYEFKGLLNLKLEEEIFKEALSLENTLWASTIMASKRALGIVIYSGKETRAQMNSTQPRSKVGVLDLELNTITKILFFIMIIAAFIVTALKGENQNFSLTMVTFFRFIVLFCGIIPISLRVHCEISKAYNSYVINRDPNIPDTIARNSTIPEELGRIEYIFTDKTGTLTKNEMIFKRLALLNGSFNTDENFEEMKNILLQEVSGKPMDDLESSIGSISPEKSERKSRRKRANVLKDSITAMSLCNNVTPIYENNSVTYQASSPDEVALVKFADSLDMKLIHRNDKHITIKYPNNIEEDFEILAAFPFSSDTKRMGIILKSKTNDKITFYLKGAENVIEKFVRDEYKSYVKENAENLAFLGLRTLVLTQKTITQEYYDVWAREYAEASTSMENRRESVLNCLEKLENNMEFLCVTGVEDLLQDEVDYTIECLRQAGIKIWMLTGDKVETAICIAISTGIKSKLNKIYQIKENKNPEYILRELEKYKFLDPRSHVLLIDGDCLEIALTNFEKEFFLNALRAPSVVCCRCSPTQKARVVQAMKKYTKKRLCAIGDGGNDVNMINQAHVGIGIVGKEGLQASLASDFSITKFKYLQLLLLWFGRLSYKNTATVCKFVMHRGLIVSLIQFIFSIIFYSTSIPLYNGMLILGYTSIYTNLPVFALLLDKDTDMKNVVKFPDLYVSLLKGREMSIKAFLWWFWKSLFQAAVIVIGALFLFDNLFLKIVTITFTALIFSELLNVYTEIKTFHHYMVLTLLGTFVVYTLSLFFLTNVLDIYYIIEIGIISKILSLTLLSWLPFYIYYRTKAFFFPSSHEKLNLMNQKKKSKLGVK
jgi:phospholipid-translocating ATPase